jgi:murein DD-endopeptidase MepM/ murein hydrolase activator NlpD
VSRRRILIGLGWVAVMGTGVLATRPTARDGALELSVQSGSPRPGGVLLLACTTHEPVRSIQGQAFGRTIEFWPAGDGDRWQALAGIPLGTKPGPYDAVIRATGPSGEFARATIGLVVEPAEFATRRLRVDPRFVTPPASSAARIAREARTLAAIFARVSAACLWDGPFVAPVPGEATSSFGRLTILNGRRGSRHLGADFRAAEGTPLVAPNTGEVVLAADYYFSGNTIVLDHGQGFFSLFAHLSRMAVTAGTRVSRGDRLGDAGATGRVTGPHLHWAVRLRGDSIDPLALMDALR